MVNKRDSDVPDLTGALAEVTGASDGLGLALAERLARAGAEIVMPVRSGHEGQRRVGPHPHCNADGHRVTADFGPVCTELRRRLGAHLVAEGRPIDILINCAAVMAPATRHVSEDGYELQFATNHLGHFALTAHLFPLLRAGHARVTTMSSFGARTAKVFWNDLQSERRYVPMKAYGQSKLAIMLFALELNRRSQAADWASSASRTARRCSSSARRGPNSRCSRASRLSDSEVMTRR